jgi:hypothetical protein
VKDSGVNQKLFVDYQTPAGARMRLKLEAKIRTVDLSRTETTADGFLIYNVQTQLAQKLQAARIRGGRAPRDLYDISFLASRFPEAVKANAEEFVEFAKDPEQLLATYASEWKEDSVLKLKSIENVVLNVGIIAEGLMPPKRAQDMSLFEMVNELRRDGGPDAVKNAEEILDAVSVRITLENVHVHQTVRAYMRGQTDAATLKHALESFVEREVAFRRSQSQKIQGPQNTRSPGIRI